MRKLYPNTNAIKTLRTDSNYTQELLAEHSGVSVRTIQNIEAGKGCKLETLKDIASVLDTPFTELLPKPKDSKYIPHWFNAIFDFFYFVAFKPLVSTIIITLSIAGFFGFTFMAMEAGFFPEPNAESIAELDALIASTDPVSKPLPELTEFSETTYFISGVVGVMFFIWIGLFLIALLHIVDKSRDYRMLVAEPLSKYIYDFFTKKFTVTK